MLKHIGTNWAQNLLQIAVMLVLTPFMIGALGDDGYGVWVAILALTGYLQLLVLGVPMASVRHIAEAVGKGDVEETNRAVSTSLGLCLALGLAALAIGALLYPVFDRVLVERWSHLSAGAIDDARLAFALVVLQVAAGFAMRLPYAVCDAYHEFPLKNAVIGVSLLVRLVLVLVLLSWRPSVTALGVVVLAEMTVAFVGTLAILRWRHPEVRFALAGFQRPLVASIFGFSIYATLLNFGTQLAYRTDALVIGGFLETSDVTDFDVGNKFFDPLTSFMLGIGMVVMPAAARFQSAGDFDELRRVVLRWSKIGFSIVLLVALYLVVLGPEFLGWWVAPRNEVTSGPVLQVLMLSFVVYLPVRSVAVSMLLGLGKPGLPALGILVMGVVNLALSLALVKPLGILGVALGTAVPNVFFAAWVLRLACREIDTPVARYVGYVAGRATLGALPALALLLWLKLGVGVAGLLPLVGAGLALVAVYSVCWLLFVVRDDPYIDVRGRIAALLKRANKEGPA